MAERERRVQKLIQDAIAQKIEKNGAMCSSVVTRFNKAVDFCKEKGVDVDSEEFKIALVYARDSTLEEKYFVVRKIPANLHDKICAIRDLAGVFFESHQMKCATSVSVGSNFAISVLKNLVPATAASPVPASSSLDGDQSPPQVNSPTLPNSPGALIHSSSFTNRSYSLCIDGDQSPPKVASPTDVRPASLKNRSWAQIVSEKPDQVVGIFFGQ